MLVIFSAFKSEAGSAIRLLKHVKKISIKGTEIYEGFLKEKKAMVFITGMGREAAEEAVKKVINLKKTGIITEDLMFLSAGICGASGDDLKIGEIVIYDSVYDLFFIDNSENNLKKIENKAEVSPEKFENMSRHFKAFNLKNKAKTVKACSVGGVVTKHRIKNILKERYDIDAFDMESFYIIKKAEKESIPILCIKSVSDNLQFPVSDLLVAFGKSSFLRKIKIIFFIIINKKERKKFYTSIRNIIKALKLLNSFLKKELCYGFAYK